MLIIRAWQRTKFVHNVRRRSKGLDMTTMTTNRRQNLRARNAYRVHRRSAIKAAAARLYRMGLEPREANATAVSEAISHVAPSIAGRDMTMTEERRLIAAVRRELARYFFAV